MAKTTTGVKKSYNMEELCVSFISRNRFYAVLLSKFNKIETRNTPTAGVTFTEKGKIAMFYNPDFFAQLSLAEAQAIIEHEVLHVFFRHLNRLPLLENDVKKENKLKNYAMDMAINQYLPDLPEGAVYPKNFKLPEGMTAEWYFEELKKIRQQQQQQKSKGGQGKGEKNPDGMPDLTDDSDSGESLDDHSKMGKTIDNEGNEGKGNGDQDFEHELEKIVRQAAKECEGDACIDNLPAGIQKELEAIKNPKKRCDWKKELKVFVNTVLTVAKRMSQKRVNRRFLETVDYILPGKKKDRKPKLLLARDTSGSVFNDEMQEQFLKEMINISKFCEVLVADCDTKVHQVYKVKSIKDFKKYKGGGGTAFEPVFVEAKKLNVDGIIYLTDTEGSFPDKKDIGKFASKTIWVTVDQDKVNVPFGKHVNVKSDDK